MSHAISANEPHATDRCLETVVSNSSLVRYISHRLLNKLIDYRSGVGSSKQLTASHIKFRISFQSSDAADIFRERNDDNSWKSDLVTEVDRFAGCIVEKIHSLVLK